MYTLNKLVYMMILIINILFSARICSHFLAMKFNIEEKQIYLKKIKNCIIAVIVSNSIFIIKNIAEYYFK